MSFPTSPEELLNVLTEGTGEFDVERILNGHSDIQWTVPAWARHGDVIFFMHSVSAINKIRLVRKLIAESGSACTPEQLALLQSGIERGLDLYRGFGGKIIGAAKLKTDPVRGFTEPFRHWKCSTYAVITDTCAFTEPLDYKMFRGLITISRTGAVTPLCGETFGYLKNLLSQSNMLPEFLQKAEIQDAAGANGSIMRAGYDTEDQFRSLIADQLLKTLSPRVFRECRCVKAGIPDSFADNVIKIGGKYLPVEIKRSWDPEGIKEQLWKYTNNDRIELDRQTRVAAEPDMLWCRYALLIDPDSVSLYDSKTDRLSALTKTNQLDRDGIYDLRDELEEILMPEG